jgi:polar amino acid transport system permease protein
MNLLRLPYQNEKAWIPYTFSWLLLFFLLALVSTFVFTQLQYDFHWDAVWTYRQKFFQGFGVTVLLSVFALITSLLVGILFALGQRSELLPIKLFSKLYIEIIRGTPLLVQILLFFYVFADAFGLENRYVVGVMILAFFAGAYVSEIIRAGIESIHPTQWETAKSLGFTRIQTYRFIIFPQVFKRILPPLAGQFVSLIKDSSLLSIISVSELTMNAQEVNSYTYSTLESYIPLALGYMLLTFPISLLSNRLEKKFSYEN